MKWNNALTSDPSLCLNDVLFLNRAWCAAINLVSHLFVLSLPQAEGLSITCFLWYGVWPYCSRLPAQERKRLLWFLLTQPLAASSPPQIFCKNKCASLLWVNLSWAWYGGQGNVTALYCYTHSSSSLFSSSLGPINFPCSLSFPLSDVLTASHCAHGNFMARWCAHY